MPSVSRRGSRAAPAADGARAVMLGALKAGCALPAGELAYLAGVTVPVARTLLVDLCQDGLLAVESMGRHHYYRLADSSVARGLAPFVTDPARPVRTRRLTAEQRKLRPGRTCYDHLAGQLGVAVTQAFLARRYLQACMDGRYAVTPAGIRWFADLGVDVASIRPARRGIAFQCLDWTERVHHVGGPLGVHYLAALQACGWVQRTAASRLVTVTDAGWDAFQRTLGVTRGAVDAVANA